MKTKILKLSGVLLPSALAVTLAGCTVDEMYSAGNMSNVDTDVTLFQNGIEVPLLKSTADLRVDSLLAKIENDTIRNLFQPDENGDYMIRYKGDLDLDSLIKSLDLANLVKIDRISFENSLSYEIGALNPDDFKSDAMDFGADYELPDFSSVASINLDPINESVSQATGLAGLNLSVDVNVDPFSRTQSILEKGTVTSAAAVAEALSQTTVSFPDASTAIDIASQNVPAFTIPSQIKKINSVSLKANPKLVVSLSVKNSIFTEGTVTPQVSVNLSDILTFGGGSGILNLNSLELNAANNYSCTRKFNISSLNISKIDQVKTIALAGSIDVSGAKSTVTRCKSIAGDMAVEINISFENFGIESVVCEIDEIGTSISRDVAIQVPAITLVEQIKSVDYVSFTDASKVSLNVQAVNIDKVPGASLKAKTLKLTFPEALEVSGEGVSGNVLTISNADVTSGINRIVKINKLNLPAPVAGKINYTANVKVEADVAATGTINSADIAALGSNDIILKADVVSDLAVGDFKVKINAIEKELPEIKGKFDIEVPEAAASFGTITITPEGSPVAKLDITLPDLGGLGLSCGEGIKILLPSVFELGSVDPALHYNAASHTMTITNLETKSYVLPISKIQATPEQVGNKWKIESPYSIEGKLTIPESTLNKADVEKISGSVVKYKVNVPQIKAASLSVDSLSFSMSQKLAIDVMKASEIPDILKSVGEIKLDQVAANLGVNLTGLPSIGANAKYMVDVTASLPSFIKPSTISLKGEIKDGKFNMAPIAIEGFDLSDIDFQALRQSGKPLSDTIKVNGRVYAQNPEVDIKTLSGTVTGTFNANISGADNTIKIKSLQAKVGYQVDTAMTVAMPDVFSALNNITFDFPDVTALLGIKTNLGIPASAVATVIPVTGGVKDPTKAIDINLAFPNSENPAKTDSLEQKLVLDLNDILNSKCDSLKIDLNVNVDDSRFCYVEPSADYTVGLKYDISIPLALGDNFLMEYADTVELGEAGTTLATILPYSAAQLKGKVKSTLPLNAVIEGDFYKYDKATDVYTKLPMKPIRSEVIKANSECDLVLEIKPETSGVDLTGLSHLKFSVKLTSDGKKIHKDSSISIKDLTLVLPEGITVDPKKLPQPEDK